MKKVRIQLADGERAFLSIDPENRFVRLITLIALPVDKEGECADSPTGLVQDLAARPHSAEVKPLVSLHALPDSPKGALLCILLSMKRSESLATLPPPHHFAGMPFLYFRKPRTSLSHRASIAFWRFLFAAAASLRHSGAGPGRRSFQR